MFKVHPGSYQQQFCAKSKKTWLQKYFNEIDENALSDEDKEQIRELKENQRQLISEIQELNSAKDKVRKQAEKDIEENEKTFSKERKSVIVGEDICKEWDIFRAEVGTIKSRGKRIFKLDLWALDKKDKEEYIDFVTKRTEESQVLKETIVKEITECKYLQCAW